MGALRRYARALWPIEVYRDTEYWPAALVIRLTKPRLPRRRSPYVAADRVVNMTEIIRSLDVTPSHFATLLERDS